MMSSLAVSFPNASHPSGLSNQTQSVHDLQNMLKQFLQPSQAQTQVSYSYNPAAAAAAAAAAHTQHTHQTHTNNMSNNANELDAWSVFVQQQQHSQPHAQTHQQHHSYFTNSTTYSLPTSTNASNGNTTTTYSTSPTTLAASIESPYTQVDDRRLLYKPTTATHTGTTTTAATTAAAAAAATATATYHPSSSPSLTASHISPYTQTQGYLLSLAQANPNSNMTTDGTANGARYNYGVLVDGQQSNAYSYNAYTHDMNQATGATNATAATTATLTAATQATPATTASYYHTGAHMNMLNPFARSFTPNGHLGHLSNVSLHHPSDAVVLATALSGHNSLYGHDKVLDKHKRPNACINCRKAKTGCDGIRPCSRCVRLDRAHTCCDRPVEEIESIREIGKTKRKITMMVNGTTTSNKRKTVAPLSHQEAIQAVLSTNPAMQTPDKLQAIIEATPNKRKKDPHAEKKKRGRKPKKLLEAAAAAAAAANANNSTTAIGNNNSNSGLSTPSTTASINMSSNSSTSTASTAASSEVVKGILGSIPSFSVHNFSLPSVYASASTIPSPLSPPQAMSLPNSVSSSMYSRSILDGLEKIGLRKALIDWDIKFATETELTKVLLSLSALSCSMTRDDFTTFVRGETSEEYSQAQKNPILAPWLNVNTRPLYFEGATSPMVAIKEEEEEKENVGVPTLRVNILKAGLETVRKYIRKTFPQCMLDQTSDEALSLPALEDNKKVVNKDDYDNGPTPIRYHATWCDRFLSSTSDCCCVNSLSISSQMQVNAAFEQTFGYTQQEYLTSFVCREGLKAFFRFFKFDQFYYLQLKNNLFADELFAINAATKRKQALVLANTDDNSSVASQDTLASNNNSSTDTFDHTHYDTDTVIINKWGVEIPVKYGRHTDCDLEKNSVFMYYQWKPRQL